MKTNKELNSIYTQKIINSNYKELKISENTDLKQQISTQNEDGSWTPGYLTMPYFLLTVATSVNSKIVWRLPVWKRLIIWLYCKTQFKFLTKYFIRSWKKK